jgi:hypothetical protein
MDNEVNAWIKFVQSHPESHKSFVEVMRKHYHDHNKHRSGQDLRNSLLEELWAPHVTKYLSVNLKVRSDENLELGSSI